MPRKSPTPVRVHSMGDDTIQCLSCGQSYLLSHGSCKNCLVNNNNQTPPPRVTQTVRSAPSKPPARGTPDVSPVPKARKDSPSSNVSSPVPAPRQISRIQTSSGVTRHKSAQPSMFLRPVVVLLSHVLLFFFPSQFPLNEEEVLVILSMIRIRNCEEILVRRLIQHRCHETKRSTNPKFSLYPPRWPVPCQHLVQHEEEDEAAEIQQEI